MKKGTYFCALLILLAGCQTSGQPEEDRERTQLQQEIEALEKQLIEAVDVRKDREAALQLLEKSATYATTYPADSLSPIYLFKAADVARGAGEYGKAIKLWGDMWRTYEDHPRAPEALFLQGFTYDNHLRDAYQAGRYYRNFLEKYPDHPFAEQARQLLSVLDKSPEELVREFEQRGQE